MCVCDEHIIHTSDVLSDPRAELWRWHMMSLFYIFLPPPLADSYWWSKLFRDRAVNNAGKKQRIEGTKYRNTSSMNTE